MSATPPATSPENTTKAVVERCLTKYLSVLTRVYATKNPKLSAKEAHEEDEWRYVTLPQSLQKKDGLTKQQLARLVKWKITHGVYRPFLPGMIQKNAETDVVKYTSSAAKILNSEPGHDNYKNVEAALKEVMNLKGVGPATGTLVLNCYTPQTVPFFADELFHWIVGSQGKLKYDKKEYAMLWTGVRKVMDRLAGVGVTDIEKAAYVLMHLDVLNRDERGEILNLTDSKDERKQETRKNGQDVREEEESSSELSMASSTAKSTTGIQGRSKTVKKRKVEVEASEQAKIVPSRKKKRVNR